MMTGPYLALLILAGVVAIVLVLIDAQNRQIEPPYTDEAEIERAQRLTVKRAEAIAKMRRHRIKPIDQRKSIGVYRAADKPRADVYAIKGGRQ